MTEKHNPGKQEAYQKEEAFAEDLTGTTGDTRNAQSLNVRVCSSLLPPCLPRHRGDTHINFFVSTKQMVRYEIAAEGMDRAIPKDTCPHLLLRPQQLISSSYDAQEGFIQREIKKKNSSNVCIRPRNKR